DRLGVFGLEASSERAYFYITLTAVVVVFAALTLANRSRTGRAWRALNDDSLAAEAMSMPINRLKVLAVDPRAAGPAAARGSRRWRGRSMQPSCKARSPTTTTRRP